jgi:hypothetical protein
LDAVSQTPHSQWKKREPAFCFGGSTTCHRAHGMQIDPVEITDIEELTIRLRAADRRRLSSTTLRHEARSGPKALDANSSGNQRLAVKLPCALTGLFASHVLQKAR